MSRKTMDEYPEVLNIYRPPRTTHQQNVDDRAKNLINGDLNDDSVVAAYNVPWRDPQKLAPQGGHLESAEEDFRDAVWGVSEGKRDVRQLRNRPEFPRR